MVRFSEFIAAAMDQSTLNDTQLEAAFKRLDVFNEGSIDEDGLKELIGAEHNSASVRQLLTDVDHDDDGRINLAEFKRAMRRMASRPDMPSMGDDDPTTSSVDEPAKPTS